MGSTIANLMIRLGMDESGMETVARRRQSAERNALRQTWIEWTMKPREVALAEAMPIMTTVALLQTCHSVGVKVTRRGLSYWQAQGVIPYPIKERRDGAVWALYPSWMVDLISAVRAFQLERKPLDQIENIIRVSVASRGPSAVDDPLEFIRQEKAERIRTKIAELQAQLMELGPTP